MLYNSFIFIVGFLPISALTYFFVKKYSPLYSKLWLISASLFFYSWWKTEYLLLLITSVLFNFFIAKLIRKNKAFLSIGIISNLLILGYYKYSNFFIEHSNSLIKTNFNFTDIVLPLAISFITFQQIAFLVDTSKDLVKDKSFLNYFLFISFFPQLISGPIVHHNEMMPQFKEDKDVSALQISAGITIFIIGLFKKVVIADSIAPIADKVFNNAGNVAHFVSQLDAWIASIIYTLQLYFDFSGYCDMAIGCGLLFGIFLPINFNSPLKSKNIIIFWRNWHITLSRFLKNYLYIPLGGNRKGLILKYVFLMTTMLLGGLWHGASVTFIIWGAIHGLLLIINHMFQYICKLKYFNHIFLTRLFSKLAWPLTFICIVMSFIVFRADDLTIANKVYYSLFSFNQGIEISTFNYNETISYTLLISLLLIIIKFSPNSQSIIGYCAQGKNFTPAIWKPNLISISIITIMVILSFYKMLANGHAEFLYRFF